MNFKKAICFALCAAVIFLFCSCGETDKKDSENFSKPASADKKDISLLYSRSDGFNPYTAKTEANRNICNLLFEPLVKTDNFYQPCLRLAKSADLNGTECRVVLKDSVFTDGSPVTADDVIYSYRLAKGSATSYASKLYEVISVSASDTKTLIFKLSRSDPYFLNLIDFPIVKADSDKNVDSDGVEVPPVGNGRYILNNDRTALEQNSAFYGQKGKITRINLINAPDSDSVSHYVEVGAAGIYYADLSDGNSVRMSGKREDVNLNNLVYIGINSAYGEALGKNMRYAVSSAINRTEICSNAYYNNAVPATGFFNPAFSPVKSTQSLNSVQDLEITVENLEKIGYNRLASDGRRVNSAGACPSFTLLVNSENASRVQTANLISKQLAQAGMNVKVVQKPFSSYCADISSGNYQLYLGEISILPNMDISQLVLPGGSAAYGVGLETPSVNPDGSPDLTSSQICSAAINNFYSGNASLSDVAATLLTEMPQIPICYRKGILFYDSSITGGVEASQSDIYFSIESYIKE